MNHLAKPKARTSRGLKHERTLTLVGALIVFFTFVVKDAVKEQVKNTTEAITAARATDEIRFDLYEIASNQDSFIFQMSMKGETGAGITLGMLTSERSVLSRMVSSILQMKSSAQAVLKTAPDVKREEKLHNLMQRFEAYDKEVDVFIADAQNPASNKNDVNQRFLPLLSKGYDIRNELVFLDADIGVHARRVLERAESQLAVWTWVSYFLYALGWGLALYARLSGIDFAGEAT